MNSGSDFDFELEIKLQEDFENLRKFMITKPDPELRLAPIKLPEDEIELELKPDHGDDSNIFLALLHVKKNMGFKLSIIEESILEAGNSDDTN